MTTLHLGFIKKRENILYSTTTVSYYINECNLNNSANHLINRDSISYLDIEPT